MTYQADDSCTNSTGAIALAPHTTEEMLLADYWLAPLSNVNSIFMTQEQIQKWNEINCKKLTSMGIVFDLTQFPVTIPGQILTELITSHFVTGDFWDQCARPVNKSQLEAMIRNCNLAAISCENPVQYGICVRRTQMKKLPTNMQLFSDLQDMHTDVLAQTAVLTSDAVVVLYESLDRCYYFIRTYYYEGWVLKCDIALCHTQEEWRQQLHFESFLVVIADQITLPFDPVRPMLSKQQFTMGTRLKYETQLTYPGTNPERVLWRDAINNYIVLVPVRTPSGMLAYERVLLPASADVCIGYLAYTPANEIRLAFSTLGNLYGWGGMYESMDCSSLVMDIYRCFGFFLPRDVSGQMYMVACKSYDGLDTLSRQQKAELFDHLPIGALLGFPGHIMIYLGKRGNEYYAINQVGSFYMKETQTQVDNRNHTTELIHIKPDSCIVNSLSVRRKNGRTWFDEITFVKVI